MNVRDSLDLVNYRLTSVRGAASEGDVHRAIMTLVDAVDLLECVVRRLQEVQGDHVQLLEVRDGT